MKKVSKIRSLVAIAALAVITMVSIPAKANDSSRVIPVELKFVGESNNQLVFQLNFNATPDENEFIVAVSDEAGHVLHKETVKGEKATKKFLFDAEEFGDNQLRFQVTSKKTNETVAFQINSSVRTVQDVVVNRL